MNATVLVLLAVVMGSPGSGADTELLAAAEQAFAEGAALRQDAVQARPAFARAAAGYDALWQRGHRNPELALNRASAHQLAGDLPRAIAALHEGLAAARWNRPLQVALEEARSAVSYPLLGDLATQCRPTPASTIGTRMSLLEAWLAAGLLWLLAGCSIARFAMTRATGWLVLAAVMLIALVILGVLWLQDWNQYQRETAEPLVIVTQDVFLRRGNAEGYPLRLDTKLPPGVEAREQTRRGGWVQIRLAGGAIGWVPFSSVLSTE